ncbi:MAG: tripartite tricarboxylate transporter substrate binding protein, partial [Thermoanaerobaculia bacterium]|nr:tripartite tricarboxylate transporter substrate binding protein [Thermoanaerobaculia bacterium]
MALLTLTTACAQGARDEAAAGADAGHVHFLIPGAPGGGWDGTARGVGETLRRSGLVQRVSYENLSGGGGGRALSHLIATAERQASTLMGSSTPSVIQALRGRHPQTYRELTPVCAVIGDYLAFVVRRGSDVASWEQLVAGFAATPE